MIGLDDKAKEVLAKVRASLGLAATVPEIADAEMAKAEQVIAVALAEATLDAIEGERAAAKAAPTRVRGIDQEDFDAAARFIERWRKKHQEARERVAYLEGALLGLASEDAKKPTEAEVEEIIAGGAGAEGDVDAKELPALWPPS